MKAMKSVSSGQSSLDHLRAGWLAMCGVFASLLVSGGAAAAPIQWTVGSGGNDHWYELVSDSMQVTWDQANLSATSSSYLGMQGYLASITSQSENTWVAGNIVHTTSAWIGGFQVIAGDQASWHWSSGEPWAFTAWATNQPDNALGGVQHALYYQPNIPLWDDSPNSWSQIPLAYVVEYSAAVPEIDPAGMGSVLGLVTGALGLLERRRLEAKAA